MGQAQSLLVPHMSFVVDLNLNLFAVCWLSMSGNNPYWSSLAKKML